MTNSAEYTYTQNPSTGEMRLKLTDGLCEASRKEVKSGNYEQLWLTHGDWAVFGEELYELNPKLKRLNCDFWDQQSDVSWIGKFTNLEELTIEGKFKGKIDFSGFKKLDWCSIQWCPSTKGILNADISIGTLRIEGFKGVLSDFNESLCKTINNLYLVGGNLVDLKGIEKFSLLKNLDLYDLRKLNDIEDLSTCMQLDQLTLGACNKIVRYDCIGKLPKLKKILFENKELNSLSSFLPGKNIESIYFGEQTKITDMLTDLALKLPNLKEFLFRDRKGYSLSSKEIADKLKV